MRNGEMGEEWGESGGGAHMDRMLQHAATLSGQGQRQRCCSPAGD